MQNAKKRGRRANTDQLVSLPAYAARSCAPGEVSRATATANLPFCLAFRKIKISLEWICRVAACTLMQGPRQQNNRQASCQNLPTGSHQYKFLGVGECQAIINWTGFVMSHTPPTTIPILEILEPHAVTCRFPQSPWSDPPPCPLCPPQD